jgi:phosphoglycerate kinase
MPKFKSVDDVDLRGKRVVIRLDLNVPIENGTVRDTTRIDRIVPSLKELADQDCRVAILAHFGRPRGEVKTEMSLKPVAVALEAALGRPVTFVATDWQDDAAQSAMAAAAAGDILLMENTRFHPGEEKNDAALAARFAALGDVYINDAFSAAHRAHSSTEAVAHLIPAVAGRTMAAELSALEAALETPRRPLVAVVGGAKISTKLELLGNLTGIADTLIIGGGMANTFLAAQGIKVGKSLCETDLLETAAKILKDAESGKCRILLPVDAVVAREFAANAPNRTTSVHDVAEDEMILDVGPQSISEVMSVFDAAATVVWNGPFGAFEIAPFDAGTVAAARHAGKLSNAGRLITVAGDGDTVAALNHAGVADEFTYVSTAGGAFLEWLEGKPLPSVAVLQV